ncbi:MAG: protein kinase [Myxococcota bacterium]|jgi:uncharacterized RDD family membrane protein YckC|nr:protein kinase [Myxococcota bacterium]
MKTSRRTIKELQETMAEGESEGTAPTSSALDDTLGPESTRDATRANDGELVPAQPRSATASDPDGLLLLGRTIDSESVKASDDDDLCGTMLHHYRVLRLLGRGAMGKVYEAHDISLDRRVALKVVALGRARQGTAERFVQEARAQAKLQHPNVVGIYYIGVQDESVFFAMELVDGGELDALLETGSPGARIDTGRAVDWMLSLCRALQRAEKAGIVHRDLKPSNILLDAQGNPKLADFGLAQTLVEQPEAGSRGFAGTPLYASPEQFRGELLDHRSDMYSLGVSFYHLLAARPPFEGESLLALARAHESSEPPPLSSLNAEIGEGLATIIHRLLAKRPEQRYASYAELITALEEARPRALQGAGVMVRGVAYFVDFVILAVLVKVSWPIAGWLGAFAFFIAYFTLFWRRIGWTPGKWLFRLRVVDLRGETLSWPRSLLRVLVQNWGALAVALLMIFSSAGSFGVYTKPAEEQSGEAQVHIGQDPDERSLSGGLQGLFLVAWLLSLAAVGATKSKRALHDRVAGSRVVYHV